MSLTVQIFGSHDNSFTLQYSGYTFPTPTKCEFKLNGTTVSSATNPEFFDFSTFDTDGKITFKMGSAGFLEADSGLCEVVVFDAVNTNGVIYTGMDGYPTEVAVNVYA